MQPDQAPKQSIGTDQQSQVPEDAPITVPTINSLATKKSPRHYRKIIIILIALIIVLLGFYVSWRIGYKEGSDSKLNGAARDCASDFHCNVLYKPAIYLYPQNTTKVNVKVNYSPGFIKTIPQYNDLLGWNVTAQPNGELTDNDGTKYPYLFWEGKNFALKYDMWSGFSVKGKDTNKFLNTELSAIGLSQQEKKDFIDYWLPILSKNKYNLIHFDTTEYVKLAPLAVTPKPDKSLRLLMVFQPSDHPHKTTPQTFPAFQRSGFTLVEWGGTQQAR